MNEYVTPEEESNNIGWQWFVAGIAGLIALLVAGPWIGGGVFLIALIICAQF